MCGQGSALDALRLQITTGNWTLVLAFGEVDRHDTFSDLGRRSWCSLEQTESRVTIGHRNTYIFDADYCLRL